MLLSNIEILVFDYTYFIGETLLTAFAIKMFLSRMNSEVELEFIVFVKGSLQYGFTNFTLIFHLYAPRNVSKD